MLAKNVRVSLCMIVRDEEQNLEACLAPVADLVDEIVIVDTGSRDSTKAIAHRFTPHVYDFAWCDDFSAARNESLKRATGDWILWLDADDRVRPQDVVRLRDVVSQLDERPRALMMDVLLPPPELNEEPRVVSHPRLFRRHPEIQWRGRVHEQLQPAFETLGYERIFTNVQIEHVGYLDRALTERKLRRKLRLLRMDYAVDPDDKSTLLHLATALCATKSAQQAKIHLMHLISLSDESADYMRWAYEALTQIALREGQIHQALEYAARGLARFAGSDHLLFLQASAHYLLGDYAATARTLEILISSPPKREIPFGSPAQIQTKLAPSLLGTVRRFQGSFAEAEVIFRGVLRQFPSDNSTWYELGLLYLDLRNAHGLKSVATQLLSLPGGGLSAGLLVALWHLRYGDLALAGRVIDDLIAMQPNLPRPRMLRAEWLSKMNAPLDTQIQALRDVLRIAPGNIETQHWLQLAMQAKEASIAPATAAWSALAMEMHTSPAA